VLSFKHLKFDYQPYPIGFAKNVLPDVIYNQMIKTWPPINQFANIGDGKFGLSEGRNNVNYDNFINSNKIWSEFRQYIKSTKFINTVINILKDHYIDLSYDIKHDLKSKFEFSSIPLKGGYLGPHTDHPAKIVTLVIQMPGESWRDEFDCGTAVLKPKDITMTFDYLNKHRLGFDKVECIKKLPFIKNGCVMFVKTYNSLHAVMPMNYETNLMRNSLTINIEK
jgi:hypothetical protein